MAALVGDKRGGSGDGGTRRAINTLLAERERVCCRGQVKGSRPKNNNGNQQQNVGAYRGIPRKRCLPSGAAVGSTLCKGRERSQPNQAKVLGSGKSTRLSSASFPPEGSDSSNNRKEATLAFISANRGKDRKHARVLWMKISRLSPILTPSPEK